MDKDRVKQALRVLQEELASAQRQQDASTAALDEVAADIGRLLDEDKPLTDEEGQSLGDRLQDAMLEFETEHPRLTGAVNQVAAALANLGI